MANDFLKPAKELKELPNNCKLLTQQITQGVGFAMAYRVCFGAAAENMSEETCIRRAKAIYNSPTMQTYANNLTKKAEKVAIRKAASSIAEFVDEAQELKGLAMTKQTSKGQVQPDLKAALSALKMIGEAQGFFNHAQEVNINIRDMIKDTDQMKAVDAAVVEEIDELNTLPELQRFISGEQENDK